MARRWRFLDGPDAELPPPRVAVAGALPTRREEWLDRAWLRLLILHTPFLPLEQEEYARLVDRYRDLEVLILGDPELQGYYAETFLEDAPATQWPGAAGTAGAVGQLGGGPLWKLHHIATVQAQLMEDVFYSSRLDRYANASENRGWMNLFRRWGRSEVFRERFDSMRATFSRDFVDFYDYYIRELPSIDLAPVPHPWDPGIRRRDTRGLPPPSQEDAEWTMLISGTAALGERYLPGVYLDSGIREAEPWKAQTPQPLAGAHAGGPDKTGAPSTSPPTPPPAPPPNTSSGDSGDPPNQ